MAEVQQAPAAASAAAAPGPIVIDTQHDDMVHDSQLDYYGTKLATASSGTFPSFAASLPSGCGILFRLAPLCVWSVRCIVRKPDARESSDDLFLSRCVHQLLSVVFDVYLCSVCRYLAFLWFVELASRQRNETISARRSVSLSYIRHIILDKTSPL